jgi:hypothetical protein
MPMTSATKVDWEEFVRSEDQISFDQYGRYLIVPQGQKKPVAHTRVTTFASTLDDRYGLERWGLRMSALGFVARNDLYARLVSTRADDKHALDKLCSEAKEAAAASAGANMGTALHAMCERVDIGEEVTFPAPFDADVGAYRKALVDHGVGIIPQFVERYVVLPDLGLGGKLDRIVDFGSQPKICDLKTGVNLDYSWGSIAVQLACYANAATLYDGRTKTHMAMPDVDKDIALVVHLPAGTARCDLYWVDIAAGWQAATHAAWVREWRKRKDLAEPWRWDTPSMNPDVRRARLVERTRALPREALETLAARWPLDVPTFRQTDSHNDDQLTMIALALATVEAEHHLEFGPPDPADTPL